MRATNTGEICILNNDGAGGFENFQRGVEDRDDWHGGCVIGEVNEVAGNAEALALEGGELACSDIVGDGLEGYGRGVVVVGVLAGDGVEEVSSIFDSAGQNPKAHQSASTRLLRLKPSIRRSQLAKPQPSSRSTLLPLVNVLRAK
jgi:hypothetical protein